MKRIVAFTIGFAIFVACSESTPKTSTTTNSTKREVKNAVAANRVLKMELTGMSCEMACGGSIREALVETGAVSRVEFVDFDMDKATNVAKVYFDKEKIKVGRIKKIVENLNDHQFTVGETSSEAFDDDSDVESSLSSDRAIDLENPIIRAENPSIELPNLIDLLKSVII